MSGTDGKLKFNNINELLEHFYPIVEGKPFSTETLLIIKILMTLGENAGANDMECLLDVQKHLKIHRILLKDLAELFDYIPHPSLSELASALQNNSQELQEYILTFDRDPAQGRAPQLNHKGFVTKTKEHILREQFDSSEVARVIAGVTRWVDGAQLSAKEQLNFTQQVIYINAIGRDYPIKVDQYTYNNLTLASRVELKKLAQTLIEQVREPILGTQQRLKAQLNLVTVMRELYFRNTGIFINTTQILSIVLAINNLQYNQYVSCEGDGKNLINSFLTAIRWVANKKTKVQTSAEEQGFFIALGIPRTDLEITSTKMTSAGTDLTGVRSGIDTDFSYRIPPHQQTYAASTAKDDIVEQFYGQSAHDIQKAVLRQFDDWQALLRLIYPKPEQSQLESELIIQKNRLITALETLWQNGLGDSDSVRAYNKTDSGYLSEALNRYEKDVEALWLAQRDVLKQRAEGKIVANSVNALRFQHLETVQLNEQLKLNKLVAKEHQKISRAEQERAKHYVSSALDIYGALLKYSDEMNKSQYKEQFSINQIKLLIKQIKKIIKKSSFADTMQEQWLTQLKAVEKFPALEAILLDYYQQCNAAGKHAEKYRMQPVIHELLRVHQQLESPGDTELKKLKEIYLDKVVTDIAEHLETTLSWAKVENRGFFYWLERSAVKEAAADLLTAVEALKRTSEPSIRKAAIKNLFKKLTHHQAQLEGLWIFSFGHKNTRDLINQTLNTLNELTVAGSGKDELNSEFINGCKEEAHTEVIKHQFRKTLKAMEERNKPWLKNDAEWQQICQRLSQIQGENNTFYMLNEMHHFISKKSGELAQSKSPLFTPLIELRGIVRNFWAEAEQKHQDLITESNFFTLKATQIKAQLNAIDGFTVGTVQLKAGTDGIQEYYDLIIKAPNSIPLLESFTRYNSQVADMMNKKRLLSARLTEKTNRLAMIEKLQQIQIPLVVAGDKTKVELNLFAEPQQKLINELFILNEFTKGQFPEDLTRFPAEIRDHFQDKNRLKDLEMETFTLAQVGQIKNQQLRDELTVLYHKIHPAPEIAQQRAWYQRLGSYLVSFVYDSSQKTIAECRQQFGELKARPQGSLTSYFTAEIASRIETLNSDVTAAHAVESAEKVSINEQIDFLAEKISHEEKKKGVMVRRFTSLEELYDFEQQIEEYKAANSLLAEDEDAQKQSDYSLSNMSL